MPAPHARVLSDPAPDRHSYKPRAASIHPDAFADTHTFINTDIYTDGQAFGNANANAYTKQYLHADAN